MPSRRKPAAYARSGRFEPPVEILLRPGGVQVGIHRAVVSFLINHQAIRARRDERTVVLRFHRPDFERDAGDFRVQRRHAIRADSRWRQTSDVRPPRAGCCGSPAPPAPAPRASLRPRTSVTRRIAIVAREAAVFAVVDALVGKIERREQPDDLAEPLLRERLRAAAHGLQQLAGGGRNQLREVRQRKFILRQASRAAAERVSPANASPAIPAAGN